MALAMSDTAGVLASTWEQLCQEIQCEQAVANAGWALVEQIFQRHDKLREGTLIQARQKVLTLSLWFPDLSPRVMPGGHDAMAGGGSS